MKLAIVGTAGRAKSNPITPDLFQAMIEKAIVVIEDLVDRGMIVDCLVSGGAAGADHVAVNLFRNGYVRNLELHLPSAFVGADSIYCNSSTGNTANYLHRKFSRGFPNQSERYTLTQLGQAIISPGCITTISDSFWTRNTKIAGSADALLAMTFGEGALVLPGGTWDTVKKFLRAHPDAPTYHMDLNTGLCYRKARLG